MKTRHAFCNQSTLREPDKSRRGLQPHATRINRADIRASTMPASGDLVFFCDQDDIWHKDKIAKMERCFQKNQEIDLLLSDSRYVYENTPRLTGQRVKLAFYIGFPIIRSKQNRYLFVHFLWAMRRCLWSRKIQKQWDRR